jgi:streptogramin lyase
MAVFSLVAVIGPTATASATPIAGRVENTVAAGSPLVPTTNGLNPVQPTRILDTRLNLGAAGAVPAGATARLQVTGRGGVPAAGVGAAVINLAVTQPRAAGHLSVFADGTARPATSSLNFSAGQTIANLVVARLGSDGQVDLYNGSTGSVQLVGDVSGWFADGVSAAGGLATVPPTRILDTRSNLGASGAVPAGGTVRLQVAGRGGVPSSGAGAAVINVAVTGPRAAGYLSVFADGTARPATSSLNFSAGQTIANLVVARLGSDGQVDLYNSSAGSVQIVGDVSGWFSAGAAAPGGLASLPPVRVLDTRSGLGASGAVPAGGTLKLQIADVGGEPASVLEDVPLNVAVTQPGAAGYITVFPDGSPQPTTSNLNFTTGQTVADAVEAQVGSDGEVDFYNGSGSTVQLVADASGWYSPSSLAEQGGFSYYHGLNNPRQIAAGPDGALWFTNFGSIGRIGTDGSVTLYGGPDVGNVEGITTGSDGALWFTNTDGESIGRITTDGTITSYSDPSIDDPYDIAPGPDGALWFTNNGNNSIGRITTTGAVTDYNSATISKPLGITAGPDGAMWFTNGGNNGNDSIGRITMSGSISAFTAPSISSPMAIAVGPDGALWFTNGGDDGLGMSIGRITATGAVTGFSGPGMECPEGITAGSDGALWFLDPCLGAIGRISTTGSVNDYAYADLDGSGGITLGSDGALWFTNAANDSIGRVTTSGAITSFIGPGISSPTDLAAGSDGAIWFTNFSNNTIGRISTDGTVTNYTGIGISGPSGIAAGADGALWFTNSYNGTIGRISTDGTVTNYAGFGLSGPTGITAGPDGALWFTNTDNNTIGRIATDGTITNYSSFSISRPTSITAGPDGALWFTNSDGPSIGRITTDGTVSDYVDPSIKGPTSITVGPDGALWFTNLSNNPTGSSIGRITTTGTVTNYTTPGTWRPAGSITTGPDGSLWFAIWGSDSLGQITTSGTITEFAGADNSEPGGIIAGPDGNLWFTDANLNAIGTFDPTN